MTMDPICGATVNPAHALSTEREGETHWFCSDACREQFLAARANTRKAGPCAIVIFDASGDLTKQKLLPALCNLLANGALGGDFAVIGVGGKEWSDDDFRREMRLAMPDSATHEMDPALWAVVEQRLSYCTGACDDPATCQKLAAMLAGAETAHHTRGNALFYLSLPPAVVGPVLEGLHASGLMRETPLVWRRLAIEKPFGHDLASTRALNAILSSALAESQIYRIDHCLGKEVAQNFLTFRRGNSIIEPIWNRNFIDHVEITAADSIGIEGCGASCESAGAFRDMMQTHLLMVLALAAMEPPSSLAGESVRNERARLLAAIRIPKPADVLRDTVRGQYGPGRVNGQPVVGYLQEPNISPGSSVETFAAVKLWVDNDRWAGVPFYLRTGKRLARRVTEIAVRFKRPLLSLRGGTRGPPPGPNLVILRIQPEAGITVQMQAQAPGQALSTRTVTRDFDRAPSGKTALAGYEKLLCDCLVGDTTLFHRSDMVVSAWQVADPILDTWASNSRLKLPIYAPGTWGPLEAETLLARDGRHWWTV